MRKSALAMSYPYIFIIVILAVLFVYCIYQAYNGQCGKFFKDCYRCCGLEDDQQNSERHSIPMNVLSPRPAPQIPSVVINRPNPKERGPPPMCPPRKVLPSSYRLQLGKKIPASITEEKGENQPSKTNVNDSEVKCKPSSINTKTSLHSESHVDLNNNIIVGVGNRKYSKNNRGKQIPEKNIGAAATQTDDAKIKVRQESQIKKNKTPWTLKRTSIGRHRKTLATENTLNFGNNEPSENSDEPYYINISSKSITGAVTCIGLNKMQATTQRKSESRKKRADSPVPDVKRRVSNERMTQHLSRYIAQNNIGENLRPIYQTSKPFVTYNNPEQLLQKCYIGNCYREPILKGITKNGSLKLKTLPELEEVSFTKAATKKDVEQTAPEEVMNLSVPHRRVMSHQINSSVLNLNRKRSVDRKRDITAGSIEENLQVKFIKNDINQSKPRRDEDVMNPTVLCSGDLSCKTKSSLWNLNGGRTRKEEIAAVNTKENSQFKYIKNDTNPSKPQGNEGATKSAVLCGGDLSCKTKAPIWNLKEGRSITSKRKIAAVAAEDGLNFKFIKHDTNQIKPQGKINISALSVGDLFCKTKTPIWSLKGERSITSKGEIVAGAIEDGLQFKFIKNNTGTSKPQGNEETTSPSELWGRDLSCKIKAPISKSEGGITIVSDGKTADGGAEDDLEFKLIKNDSNTIKPQANEMVNGMAMNLPSVPLKRKQVTDIKTKNTSLGREIESRYAKDNRSKINCFDINLSKPQDSGIVKGMTLNLLCESLKRKQLIGNNNETGSSGSSSGTKSTNDIYNLKNKGNFIKNEMGFTRITSEENIHNFSQRFPEEIQLRKSCKLHASDEIPHLIPIKYLQNKVSSNNFNVSECADTSKPQFNLYSEKSSKELRNLTIKDTSMVNDMYGLDQKMEPGFMNAEKMHLGEPSDRNKNSNPSLNASLFAKDKSRNFASMNIANKNGEKEKETF